MKRREFLELTAAPAAMPFAGPATTRLAAFQAGGTVDPTIATSGAPILIGLHAALPLPKNGRQLARRRDGTWFLAYACHTRRIADRGSSADVGRDRSYGPETEIRMRASRTASHRTVEDFGPEEVLVKRWGGYVGPTARSTGHVIAGDGGADAGAAPSMVIDPRDVLHLAWVRPGAGEIWYARCDVSGPSGAAAIARTESWQAERIAADDADLGDICLDGNGRPCVVFRNREGITFARYDGGWRRTVMAAGVGLQWPTLACDRSGALHVVWRDGQRLLHYLRSTDGGTRWTGADGKTGKPDFIGGYCHEAPSLAAAGGDVLAAHYQSYRVITFSHHDGRRWHENTVVPGSYNHNSPMLVVDRHEVIWMHMVCGGQDWTRTSRWLGDGWGELQEGRRVEGMANACSAERVMPAEAQEFGVVLADRSHRLYLDTFAVPAPATAKGQHVMMLDLWEVARLEAVEQTAEPMEKDPRNPVLKHGPAGSWDAEQANFEGTIFKEGDRYRLWYTGLDAKPYFPFKAACGYAESRDGVNWTKPDLGLYEYGGNKRNNICYDRGFAYAVVRVPEDAEPDPARRYRMAFSTGSGASLAFSLDGTHWTLSEHNPLWTAGRAGEMDQSIAENSAYIHDPADPDPERRFKAYPQIGSAEKGRTVGLMISKDGIHFKRYANNPVVDPALGVERQNHYVKVCWRRHGVFIGLYGCYLDNVNIDARLIVSRDGVHWVRVKKEVPLISTGEPGSWDAAMVFPSNYPIVEGEDVWVYYSGFELNFTGGEGHASTGRARVRLDGFAKVQLQPGQKQGALTTVPFEVREREQGRLVVNADRLARDRRTLLVEVLDADTGKVLPGFSAKECNPLVQDGIGIPVSWATRSSLGGITAKRIRFRFVFSGADGSPRLSSFGFA